MKWLLKNQLISVFFEDMQDNVEEVLELLQKLLGGLQSPLLKNYLVPAAKKIGADLFEIAVPEIEEVVSGRMKLETFGKHVGTKAVRKQLGGEKRNLSVELVELDPFLRKSRSKNSRSRKDFFENRK